MKITNERHSHKVRSKPLSKLTGKNEDVRCNSRRVTNKFQYCWNTRNYSGHSIHTFSQRRTKPRSLKIFHFDIITVATHWGYLGYLISEGKWCSIFNFAFRHFISTLSERVYVFSFSNCVCHLMNIAFAIVIPLCIKIIVYCKGVLEQDLCFEIIS